MVIVTGTSGVGKTSYIYENIKNDLKNNKKVLLLVPDREAVEAETSLVSMLDDVPCQDLDVYGFSRMCNDFFRMYGSLCYHYIDKTSSELLVFLALCNVADSLTEYKGVKLTDRDVIGSLANTISSLKRTGTTPTRLECIFEEMQEDGVCGKRVLDKLGDVLAIYTAYEILLKRGYDDPDDDMTKMISMLPTHPYFKNKSIYIDSFSGFTPVQYEIIEFMARQSDSLTVSLLISPKVDKKCGEGVFYTTYKAFNRLKSIAEKSGKELSVHPIYGQGRYNNDELCLLEASFYSEVRHEGDCEHIALSCCDTVYDEVNRVCCDIAKRVREGGRWRDYCIVVPDTELYSEILRSCFEKHKISYYMSRRTEIMRKPFIKSVLYALRICEDGFYYQSVISYIKTGMLPLPEQTVFMLENYINTWHISGKAFYGERWQMSPSGFGRVGDDDEEKLKILNEAAEYVITPLYDMMTRIKENNMTCADYCDAICKLLQTTRADEALTRAREEARERGDEEEVMQLGQVWKMLFSSMQTLCDICTDAVLGVGEYSELLELVLSKVDIGTIPTSADAVSVGGYDSLVGKHPVGIYIMGMNEDKMPSPLSSPTVFSENDLLDLCEYGVDIEATLSEVSKKQLFDFYKASGISSDFVRYSYFAATVTGQSCRMSRFLDGIITSFPCLEKTKHDRPSISDGIFCEESGIEACAKYRDSAEAAALLEIFSENEKYADIRSALDLPITNAAQSLSEDSLKKIYPSRMKLSQSKIKQFKDCRFAYYCKYSLGLKQNPSGNIKASDVGTFMHYILQRAVDDKMCGVLPEKLTDGDIAALCDKYIAEYLTCVLGVDKLTHGAGRLKALGARLRRNMLPMLKYVFGELEVTDFKPVATELKTDSLKPVRIKLSDGGEAILSGIADRVDIYQKDGIKYVKLIDYKTGENSFKYADLNECEGIQLFLYMISIIEQNDEYRPAALFYMSGCVSEEETNESKQLTEDDIAESVVKRGVVLSDDDIIYALARGNKKYLQVSSGGRDKKMLPLSREKFEETFDELKNTIRELAEEMKKGNADATPKKSGAESVCERCPYKFVCRSTAKTVKK